MKTEKIVSVSLEDENTVKTVKEVYEPRYEGYMSYSEAECDMVVEDFMEQNKAWITKNNREGFDKLDTEEDWEPEGNSVEADIESFQKYLDDTYGKDKYEAYALGAYIHGSVSFAFNKGEDNRCRWDSGTVGFVGINKECQYNVNLLASQLSDAWNGWIYILQVYDNYESEIIEETTSLETDDDIDTWKENMKQKYGVTEFKEEQ